MDLKAVRAQRNFLLAGLPSDTLAALLEDFDVREMRVKDTLLKGGETIAEAVFPLTGVVSVVAKGAEDQIIEVATIGNEGMTGVSIFLGSDTPSNLDAFVQIRGEGLFMRTRDFRKHIDRDVHLRKVLGLYTQALLSQISQGSVCNRMHPAEERCARWLLQTQDRVDSNRFDLTQEFLAMMLGVRRVTVTEVASALQNEGIIRYSRGSIEVLDRSLLEDRSCECYRIIQAEYERLLPRQTRDESDPP